MNVSFSVSDPKLKVSVSSQCRGNLGKSRSRSRLGLITRSHGLVSVSNCNVPEILEGLGLSLVSSRTNNQKPQSCLDLELQCLIHAPDHHQSSTSSSLTVFLFKSLQLDLICFVLCLSLQSTNSRRKFIFLARG